MASRDRANLACLPTEILEDIFTYVDDNSLGVLSRVCRRFRQILNNDRLWEINAKTALVTNLISEKMQNRTLFLPSLRERCRFSHNWRIGKYSERHLLIAPKTSRRARPTRVKGLMPWLQLQSDLLWFSRGQVIDAFKRQPGGQFSSKPVITLTTQYPGGRGRVILNQFVVRDGLVVSGSSEGHVFGWALDANNTNPQPSNFRNTGAGMWDVHAVDVCQGILLSSSRPDTVDLWDVSGRGVDSPLDPQPLVSVEVGDRVWCVAGSSEASLWACGTAGLKDAPPLHVCDLASGELLSQLGSARRGAGLLQIVWESPQLLLACGYEASVNLYDLRTESLVGSWEDPQNATLYSLSTDHHNSVLCGTSIDGRALLFDRRHSRAVQMYFADYPPDYNGALRNTKGPVYCLDFDAENMFLALDTYIHVLDFTSRTAHVRNWSRFTGPSGQPVCEP